MNKINSLLGISRKANYIIIGSDNLKNYHKKLYLILVNTEISKTIDKIIKDKTLEYDIPCIVCKEDFSQSIGLKNVKIIGLKNKGIADEILKQEQDYFLRN